MFAETHTQFRKCGVGGGEEGGGWGGWGGAGDRGWGDLSTLTKYGGHMSQNLHWNTKFLRFYKNHYIIGLDSERAGSRTLEKFSRRDWDRDCAKFENSRCFRGSNTNPKKKSRRCQALVSIQALDLAISRFIHSLECNLVKKFAIFLLSWKLDFCCYNFQLFFLTVLFITGYFAYIYTRGKIWQISQRTQRLTDSVSNYGSLAVPLCSTFYPWKSWLVKWVYHRYGFRFSIFFSYVRNLVRCGLCVTSCRRVERNPG